MIKSVINHIEAKDGVTMIFIEGFSQCHVKVADIFNHISASGAEVDMIIMMPSAFDRLNLSFTVCESHLSQTVSALGKIKAAIPKFLYHISSANTKIILSGTAVYENPDITTEVLKTLADAHIQVKMISAAVNEISLLVDESDAGDALKLIKKRLEYDRGRNSC